MVRVTNAIPLGCSHLLPFGTVNSVQTRKVSFADRVKYIEENMHHVHASADDPFSFDKEAPKPWWQKSENPWQTFAACVELSDAMRSPDPHAFESCLPVHQDGTCNGLQHYAALGGDTAGAKAVNLCPVPGDDKPQDVYMAVVDMVNAMVSRHAAGDFTGIHPGASLRALENDEFVAELATLLLAPGPIARKTVKQTIMTSVYGVTFIGTVPVFRQKFSLELQAIRRVANGIPLGCPLFLPIHTVNCVQTLKVLEIRSISS
jgi:DNA-directed RNA polymerase